MNLRVEYTYFLKGISLVIKEFRTIGWFLHSLIQDYLTINTKQGRLTVSTKDLFIGKQLYVSKHFEYDFSIHVLKFLKDSGFLPEKNVIMIDIGANIGMISIGLLRSGLIDQAIAFEPETINFNLLQRNISQNGLNDKIIPIHRALGESHSMLTMELSPTNLGDHRIKSATPLTEKELNHESERKTINVESIRLDDISRIIELNTIDLSTVLIIWIDVQGYEGFVFKGGKKFLARGIPTVSEISPYGILRAGMTIEDFTHIVSHYWSYYWVERNGRFIRYPISVFSCYIDELGFEGGFGNVIFTVNESLSRQ